MKTRCLIIFLLSLTFASYGQTKSPITDTLGTGSSTPKSIDSLSFKNIQKIDSATNRINFKIDSLQARGLPTAHFQRKLDSINGKLQFYLSLQPVSKKIDTEAASLKSKLNDPRANVQKKLDKKKNSAKGEINKKKSAMDSITTKIHDPTGQVKLPSSDGFNTNLTNPAIPNANLPNSLINSQTLNLSNETNELNRLNKSLAMPQSEEMKKIEGELKQIENAPKQELNSTGITKEVNEIKKEAKEVTALEKKTDGYKKDLKDIKEGDKEKINSLEKDAENRSENLVSNVSEVKELKKEEAIVKTQKNAFQQYEEMVSNLKKENGLTEVKNISTKALPNPLLGQEVKLQAGMTQLDKLKKKYHAISDSRSILKRAPNEMRGKPLRERLIPGLSFQLFQGKQIGMDFSPYIMYRLSGRFRLGTGVSDRLVFDNKKWDVSSGHIQAIRIMTDFRLIPTFNLHAEEEWTHYGAGAQYIYSAPSDPPLKEWNTKFNVGVLKTYKISRHFDGQMQLLYNAKDWSNFPQSKNTTMRFGFEYKFGIKKIESKK